ncbi:hypothetical protein F0562_030061 [Nyssa sinensis]|uniref:Bulb-type lectin domain-containing protein n=1 Tax=Nyssa sinensis TaxID=561372 RepID=A0A5J5AXK3_9ASTE|nr:hypothetical protein F0562_030061 [Nyssa sinensis]
MASSLMMASMRSINSCLVILCCFSFFKSFGEASRAGNTLKPGQVMRVGEHLESLNKKFRLQFFKESPTNYGYLVIQYMGSNAKSTVWVANRDNPQYYSSLYLNFTLDGKLVVDDGFGYAVRLNYEQTSVNSDTSATLDDSGNFVLRKGERILWQSFDHLTDTLLPGMKLGLIELMWDSASPQKRFLTSRISPEVPATGSFALGVNPDNRKQLVVWKGKEVYWRSETWNGQSFSSFFGIQKDIGYNLSYFSNENEFYFIFLGDENSYLPLIQIDWRGQIILLRENSMALNLEPSKCKGDDVFTRILGLVNGWHFIVDLGVICLRDCAEICQNNCSCDAFTCVNSSPRMCKFAQVSHGDNIDGSVGEIIFIRRSILVGNTLKPGHVMGMGEYLESFNKKFRLQFLKHSLSDYGCLVIQYMGRNAESTVWVANQLYPQYYYPSVLNFTLDRYLVIDDGYWSFVQLNIEQPGMSSDTSATLEDSGNFVLREGEQILWQSSDNPTNTLLPGMKLGLFDLNSRKPQKQFLTSWISPEVLNAGLFTLGVDPNNTKQLVVWKRDEVYWCSETWNGQNFSSLLGIQKDIGYNLSYFSNENESYFIFLVDENIYSPLLQIVWRGQIALLSENSLTINLAPSKCKDGDVFRCRISEASQGYKIDGAGETLFIRKSNLSA